MGQAFGELAVKFVLLSSLSALVLMLTTGFSSNIAGTIVAVLGGTGCTALAYAGISTAINKLFSLEGSKAVYFSELMPDGLYRSNLIYDNLMNKAVSIGIMAIFILMFFTLKLYNKKDIK